MLQEGYYPQWNESWGVKEVIIPEKNQDKKTD